VRDDEIDDMLRKAGAAQDPVDPRLLDRIGASIRPTMKPVRPLLSPMLLTSGLVAVCAAVALAVATKLGFAGLLHLSTLQRSLIFPSLVVFVSLSAAVTVAERLPGARRRLAPGGLLAIGSTVMIGVFAVVFHDYGTERFVAQGTTCLKAGLLTAIPAVLVVWLLLRRGYAVNPASAGLGVGMIAGLAGLLMLELHCANFEAPHVMLWHMAVVWVAGAAGALLARTAAR
jgi:hypothetical protein